MEVEAQQIQQPLAQSSSSQLGESQIQSEKTSTRKDENIWRPSIQEPDDKNIKESEIYGQNVNLRTQIDEIIDEENIEDTIDRKSLQGNDASNHIGNLN